MSFFKRITPLVLCLFAACGGEATLEPLSGNSRASTTDAGATGGTGGSSKPAADSGTMALADAGYDDGCSAEARDVYVISHGGDLYRFAPKKLEFTKIGAVKCGPYFTKLSVYSMAVDRDSNAWVLDSQGVVWKVSTRDATCEATTYVKNTQSFSVFGMGITANAAGSKAESLFIAGGGPLPNSQSLGTIDLVTKSVTRLGTFTDGLAAFPAELTGTADGRLYGFFPRAPKPTLALINKATGATPKANQVELPGIPVGGGFAFSFWGGDFWFYSSNTSATSSSVARYKASGDKSVSVVVASTGFVIVGAGVSSCAPLVFE